MANSDKIKTIDGFAYWIENEENGVCYIPLNLCEKVMKLLKEQEPIEPRNTYLTTPSGKIIPHIFCGKCNKEIYAIYAFCPYCGQAVKWNE